MIQNLTFRIPLAERPYLDAEKALQLAAERMKALHPRLLGVTVAQASNGDLELILRASGLDRWKVQADARKIAAIMFRRAAMDYHTAVLAKTESEPDGRMLTKEQGRQFSHAGRGVSFRP